MAVIRRRFSSVGGAELYLQRFLPFLSAAGVEVHLLTEAWEPLPEGIILRQVPTSVSRGSRYTHFSEQVGRILKAESFDSIFSLERTRQQHVFRAGDGVHAVSLERRRRFSPWWKRFFIGKSFFHRSILHLEKSTFDPANTRFVIVNSEMVRTEILQRFDFPAERIRIVRNGIDLEKLKGYSREKERGDLGLPQKDFVILFAGSGWERKGLRYLLDGFLKLYSRTKGAAITPKLLVAGKGQPLLQHEAIRWIGPVAEMGRMYATADLFALLPIYEPCANACLEALALGIPVVTTPYNGAAEFIQPGLTGTILDHPERATEVAQSLRFWMDSPAKRHESSSHDLSMERNFTETFAILKEAADCKL